MSKNKSQIVDQIGIVTSGLCALHCAALPLMISLGLISNLEGSLHDSLEMVVIFVSACLGVISIYNGVSGHGRILPQLLIGLGAFFIIIGLLSPTFGHGFMAIGGAMLLYGHWNNWRQLSIRD